MSDNPLFRLIGIPDFWKAECRSMIDPEAKNYAPNLTRAPHREIMLSS